MKQRLFIFVGVSLMVVSCGKSYSGRYAGNETLTLAQTQSTYGYQQPYQQPGQPAAAAPAPITGTGQITLTLPEADGSGTITGGQWSMIGVGNNARTGTFSAHANGSGFDNVLMTETNPQPIPQGGYGGGMGGYQSGGTMGSSCMPSAVYFGTLSYANNKINGTLQIQNQQQAQNCGIATSLTVDAVKQQ